jgi:hypothetical protein
MAARRATVGPVRESAADPDRAEALAEAECQMAEHEVDLFNRLLEGVAAYVPKDLSADERRHVIEGLAGANPELREVAQRLAILQRFRHFSSPD